MRDPTPDEVRGFLEFAGLSDNDAPLAVRALKVRALETLPPPSVTRYTGSDMRHGSSKETTMCSSW